MGRTLSTQRVLDVQGGAIPGPLEFEDFVESEHPRLFRALYLMTGSREEAEEVMQDAFLKVWERWDRISRMDDATGYLFRTAMNLWRKRIRRAALSIKRTVLFSRGEDGFAAVEDREVVFAALRRLRPNERASIVLTALLDYSSEEAGELLGTSAATARMLASRARTKLRQTMEEWQ